MSHGARVAEDSIRRHSKSFSLASRLLPPGARQEAVVIYAWCRRADDAVDLVARDEQPGALAQLEAELERIYASEPMDDPILGLFQEVVLERGIPIAYPRDLLAGMEMDVLDRRYGSLEELLEYCYCVAGCVGLMMCHVMGVRDDGALRNAAHLGIAMQLTNICRDVLEDWQRGRLYVPVELLEGTAAASLVDRLGSPFPDEARGPVAEATGRLLAEADRYYASGDAGLPALSWRCALAIRTARQVYAAIGTRIRRAGCDPLAGRAIVPLGRKLTLLLGCVGASIVDGPGRLGSAQPAPRSPTVVTSLRDVLAV